MLITTEIELIQHSLGILEPVLDASPFEILKCFEGKLLDADEIKQIEASIKDKRENQCDGCRRGLPINEHGHHYNPDGSYDYIGCTKHLYK